MLKRYHNGLIEVITGPMFSGKTEELIKRIRILEYAGMKSLVIKPKKDKRFADDKIKSRSGTEKPTAIARNGKDILSIWDESYDAIIIDEVQFFDEDIIPIIEDLASSGKLVIVSGIDTDYKMKPFGIMPYLLAIADEVVKLVAVCLMCKSSASKSYRKSEDTELTKIGDKDEYEARCRSCHDKGMKNRYLDNKQI
ncbi:MAG: thymidine kinase [Metamycoplasmataceae bacterium]